MRIRLTDSPPRAAAATRVAFLHEARDPAAGSPAAARPRVRAAVRAAGFRGQGQGDRRRTAAGLDRSAASGRPRPRPAALRAALRRAVREARGAARRDRSCCASAPGCPRTSFRALLPQIALADYAFDRYKSAGARSRGAGRRDRRPAARASRRASLAAAVREAEAIAEAVRVGPRRRQHARQRPRPGRARARKRRRSAQRRGLRFRVLDKTRDRDARGWAACSASTPAAPGRRSSSIGEYAPRAAARNGRPRRQGHHVRLRAASRSSPPPSMGEMKYDMMGAATVFACLARGAGAAACRCASWRSRP